MYQDVCQRGLISILFSLGNKPLLNWRVENKDGIIKRQTEPIINSLILEFKANAVSNNYIECPKDPKENLHIFMRYFIMIVKNCNYKFCFEVIIIDVDGFKRIFRLNNTFTDVLVHPFNANIPLRLYPNWNTIVLDLEKLTQHCYGRSYSRTQRVKVYANFAVRRIFFSDRPYKDSELPASYKVKITPNLQAPLV